jgi:histidinol-phosphate aminotransferase
MSFASEAIIDVYNKVKPPYNISQSSQELVLKALENVDEVNEMIRAIVAMREDLIKKLKELAIVKEIFPSDANFFLVKFVDPKAVYSYLLEKEIVVRDRSRVELCEGCLRITVGTERENRELVIALQQFSN